VVQYKQRREFVRITDEVAAIVKTSSVREGTVLVSAMHITSGVFVNDWERPAARLRGVAREAGAADRATGTIRPARTTRTPSEERSWDIRSCCRLRPALDLGTAVLRGI
jgi:hypothetical protein